jgi:hypothetical protein
VTIRVHSQPTHILKGLKSGDISNNVSQVFDTSRVRLQVFLKEFLFLPIIKAEAMSGIDGEKVPVILTEGSCDD